MLDAIYGWIQNLAVYLIMISAVLHVIPGKDYGKYIRFFSGLVLILLLFTPVLKLTGMEQSFRSFYSTKEYEMEQKEIERALQIYEQSLNAGEWESADPAFGETKDGAAGDRESLIRVEEIEIGE